jgi:hypothetical protein
MKEGTLYGNDNLFINHGNASDQPLLSKIGTQEDLQVNPENEKTKSEFNSSTSRLDHYHLTFSSRL